MGEREHVALANAYVILGLGNIPKGGLLKSSSSLFHEVSFSLAVYVDPTWAGNPTERKLLRLTLNATYRNKFHQLIVSLHKRFPHLIKPINKSHLVQAGGPRVVRCLFQLSTVALYLTLENNPTTASLVHIDSAEIKAKTETVKKESAILISQTNTYTENAEEILKLYKQKSGVIDKDLKEKRDILKLCIEKLSKKFPDRSNDIQQLLNLKEEPKILKDWKCEINNHIIELEKRTFLKKKITKFSECVDKSKMVVKRRIEKRSSEFTLEFNAGKDCIQQPGEFFKNDLNTVQLLSLKNIQHGETLNFPNLIKSFAVVMSFIMKGYFPIKTLESAIEIIDDRLSYIQIVDDQSKDIQNLLSNFLKELKVCLAIYFYKFIKFFFTILIFFF